MSWLDEMEAADPAYPGDVSYPAARTRAGRGPYQLHAGLDDGHLDAARDLIADWYARQAFTSSITVSVTEAPKYVQITDELMAESITREEARHLITTAAGELREGN